MKTPAFVASLLSAALALLAFTFFGCKSTPNGVGEEQQTPLVASGMLFLAHTPHSYKVNAYSMNEDGTGMKLAFPHPYKGVGIQQALWSPDGKKLAVVFNLLNGGLSETDELAVVSPTDSIKAWVTGSTSVNIAWSPDGQSLAFNDRAIHIVALNGQARRTIQASTTDSIFSVFDWCRNGEKLLISLDLLDSRSVIKRGELWEMSLEGRLLRKLFSPDSSCATYARWSPQEDAIALILDFFGPVETRHMSVWCLNADGTSARRIAPEVLPLRDYVSYGRASGLAWSPDGQKIAYAQSKYISAGDSSVIQTFVVTRTGEQMTTLFPDASKPAWICDWR